jgi:hypothetical protein
MALSHVDDSGSIGANLQAVAEHFNEQPDSELDWGFLNQQLNITQPVNLPPVPAKLTFGKAVIDSDRRFVAFTMDWSIGRGVLVVYYGTLGDLNWTPSSNGPVWRAYVAVTIKKAFAITEVPAAGSLVSGALGISNLGLLITTTDLTKDEAKTLTALITKELSPDGDPFPTPLEKGMYSRATFRCYIDLLGSGYPLTLELFAADEDITKKSEMSATEVKRNIGPFSLLRAGLNYMTKDGANVISLDLDAEIQLGPMHLVLEGLTFDVPISQVDDGSVWKPHLMGGAVGGAISGAVRFDGQLNVLSQSPINLTGGVMVSVENQIGVAGMAGYATTKDETSFFGYGFLKFPADLPQPIEIEGAALGFSYNRDLLIPTVEKLNNFPFIAAAMSFSNPAGAYSNPFPPDPTASGALDGALAILGTTAPPKDGAYWFTAGVAFSLAGRTLKGFVLLSIEIGCETRIAAVGELRATVPPEAAFVSKTPKILFIDTFLDIIIDATGGLISVDAYIKDNSFIVEQNAKLTGAFALRIWTGGDHRRKFVLSVGGYSPHLNLASYPYYPTVPRLKMSLQLSDMVQVQGETYFALTSALVTYGVSFQISAKFGPVKVWANILFDVLLAWDPFHYDLDVELEFGATARVKVLFVHISVTAHIGAGLHIWGPTFTGKARLDFMLFSVSFHLGGNASPTPDPIAWTEFKTRYLPPVPSDGGGPPDDQDKTVVGLDATADQMITLKRAISDDIAWVVDPETTIITTRTVIPANSWSATCLGAAPVGEDLSAGVIIGVVPCQIEVGLSMAHVVTVTGPTANVKVTPILAAAPAAMWGDHRAKLDDPGRCVQGAVVGLTIEPVHPTPDVTLPADTANLLAAEDTLHLNYLAASTGHAGDFGSVGIADTIASTRASANRAALFAAFPGLLLDAEMPDVGPADVNVSGFAAGRDEDLFISPPRFRLLGENRV